MSKIIIATDGSVEIEVHNVTTQTATTTSAAAPQPVPYRSEIGVIFAQARGETVVAPPVQQPTYEGAGSAPTIKVRPGDDLPWPSAAERSHVVILEQPLGEASYRVVVPLDFKGNGWIKGRAATGDNFSVAYSLTVERGVYLDPQAYGSMELPLHFGEDEVGGMSNLRPGAVYWLNIDNKTNDPIALQIARP